MASYTIEDIELIRRKSSISYQEAVALLDYHNGNVARALVDLERNGRIKPESAQAKASGNFTIDASSFFSNLYRFRLKVKKGHTVIVNLSLLFGILTLLLSPHLLLIGLILALVLGYRISFDRKDPDFASANLEKMVRNAGENVRDSFRSFQEEDAEAPAQSMKDQPFDAPEATPERSYYASHRPAKQPFKPVPEMPDIEIPEVPTVDIPEVPTIKVPVQVESQDGHVRLESEEDGYHKATIE